MDETRIPLREKIQLLLEGAGTITGVPVSKPAKRAIIDESSSDD